MLNLEMNNPTFDNVKKQARHHWVEILVSAGVDAKALKNFHGSCPGCKGKVSDLEDNYRCNLYYVWQK